MPEFTCTCGKTFAAGRANARYCSDKCRKRTNRAPGADVVPIAPESANVEAGPHIGPIEAAARSELEQADRLDTSLGQVVVALARRLDRGEMETGSAYSSLANTYDAKMAAATRGAGKATAPGQLQDELEARRRRHA
ncbi:MAG TPA: hypothetical protein PLX57_08645 [Ornithinibacter sp.]|nr:hypothetical protein [Ornithinibacter sp.]HQW73902.1 hypothetical protein [Ornithinibacter sp.]